MKATDTETHMAVICFIRLESRWLLVLNWLLVVVADRMAFSMPKLRTMSVAIGMYEDITEWNHEPNFSL